WRRNPLLELLEKRVLLTNNTAVSGILLPTVVNTSGAALSFNGVNDFAITPDLHSLFASTSVTLQVWFNAKAPGVIVDELGQSAVNQGWHDSQLEIVSSGHVFARVWNLPSVDLGTASFGSLHVVDLRYNNSTGNLDGFLDGVQSSGHA